VAVFVTPAQELAPTHAAKSAVPPSPVIAVDGNETVVPAQPPLLLHDRASVYVTATPLAVELVAGVIAMLGPPAANAGLAPTTATPSARASAAIEANTARGLGAAAPRSPARFTGRFMCGAPQDMLPSGGHPADVLNGTFTILTL
jgi:hypothetical protein